MPIQPCPATGVVDDAAVTYDRAYHHEMRFMAMGHGLLDVKGLIGPGQLTKQSPLICGSAIRPPLNETFAGEHRAHLWPGGVRAKLRPGDAASRKLPRQADSYQGD